MSVYAIGDVQGCFKSLQALLKRLRYKGDRDELWFVGDLVNRGPDSLSVLRFVRALGDGARMVLGNHDLNLLAVAVGARPKARRDTLQAVLEASDRDQLLDWLIHRPLFVQSQALDVVMVHAGLLPQWTLSDAAKFAGEIESVLRSSACTEFLGEMYGDRPDRWSTSLVGWDRHRVLTNVFTRIRFCDRQGKIDLRFTGPPGSQPKHLKPWFEWRCAEPRPVLFGHWSALGARTIGHVVCLDSGCVWGNRLTAARLDSDTIELISVPCQEC